MEQVFSNAWDYFKQHYKFLLITTGVGYFIPMLFMLIPSLIIQFQGQQALQRWVEQSNGASIAIIILVMLLAILACAFTQVGLRNAAIKITKGETPTFNDILLDFDMYLKQIGAAFICGIMIIIGAVFCILPGIVLAYFVALVSYELLDNPETTISDAISFSFSKQKEHWKITLPVILIASIITNIATYSLLGIIAALPFYELLIATTIRQIKDMPQNTYNQYDNNFNNNNNGNQNVPPTFNNGNQNVPPPHNTPTQPTQY